MKIIDCKLFKIKIDVHLFYAKWSWGRETVSVFLDFIDSPFILNWNHYALEHLNAIWLQLAVKQIYLFHQCVTLWQPNTNKVATINRSLRIRIQITIKWFACFTIFVKSCIQFFFLFSLTTIIYYRLLLSLLLLLMKNLLYLLARTNLLNVAVDWREQFERDAKNGKISRTLSLTRELHTHKHSGIHK